MVAKAVLLVCAQALFIQSIAAQCIGAAYPAIAAGPCGAGLGYGGIGALGGLGCGAVELAAPAARGLAASNGAGLAIASTSAIPPVGMSVASDNIIEGILAVGGALPFLGTVGLEGVLPTAGAGAVSYNCGSGVVGITAEDIAAAPLGLAGLGLGIGSTLGIGPLAVAGPLGLNGALGCGCGIL